MRLCPRYFGGDLRRKYSLLCTFVSYRNALACPHEGDGIVFCYNFFGDFYSHSKHDLNLNFFVALFVIQLSYLEAGAIVGMELASHPTCIFVVFC